MAFLKFATSKAHRERRLAFLDFTWRRFVEDRCLQTAGALAFTTLFALVPLTAAALGVLAMFPSFAEWRDRLTDWIFRNFVPAAGDVVQSYVTEFAANASKATTIGVLVLVFSAIALMMSIEDAFNRIWRVKAHRAPASRFVIYWTALSLGPLLLVSAMAVSSYLFALPFIDAAAIQFSLKARLLSILPFLIIWVTLMTAYMVIPNRGVRIRHAVTGALIAAVLFELSKRGFGWYAGSLANYQQVYGAMSMVPIFFFWVYLSWIVVLLGASITASLSSFDYRCMDERITPDQELSGMLKVLAQLAQAHREGRGLDSAQLRSREPYLTDDLLQRYLADLGSLSIIRRSELGEWILARDLNGVTLLDLYRKGGYRLPVDDQRLPGDAGQAPPAVSPLQDFANSFHTRLDVPLASLITLPSNGPPSLKSDSGNSA